MFGGGNSFGKADKNDFDDDFGDIRSDFSGDSVFRNQNQNKFRFKDTISELYDDDEKEAVFKSSMKKGGAINEYNMSRYGSPLGQKGSPERMEKAAEKISFAANYREHPQPDLAGAFRRKVPKDFDNSAASPDKFQQFIPRETNVLGPNFHELNSAFGLRPKKTQTCKKHRETPIEFYSNIQNDFYCRICAKDHTHEDAIVISDISLEVQQTLVELKHTYLTKKTLVIDRLMEHQNRIENFFKIYYDTLDQSRKEMLAQEYEIRAKMEKFEKSMKKFLHRAQTYSTVEFFLEQHEIKDEINKMKSDINQFSTYIPKVKLRVDDMLETTKKIQEELKAKLAVNLQVVDNSFALDNFNFVTNEIHNQRLSDIYKLLGPFDFNLYEEDKDDDKQNEDSSDQDDGENQPKREMQYEFENRKSGAQFRGEISTLNHRPDGRGFKVFNLKSVYEGYFANGSCHGFGRGITSNGEVFQGGFSEDQMDGQGFFCWPDGRIYEGEWQQGKKHGRGKYFWPNGQVYEGDFKNDNCNGYGILFYPDGKRYEGYWRDGAKHGKGIYVFPGGALFHVVYTQGKKASEGKLENSVVSIEKLKDEYSSLAKKASSGKDFMKRAKNKQMW